jgi:hypothetical protein
MVCAPYFWADSRLPFPSRGGRVCPLFRHAQSDPILRVSGFPVLSKVQNWRIVISTYKGPHDPVTDFKAFCRAISVSYPLKSLEVIMVPDGREREIKQHLLPYQTTSRISTDSLLSHLESLRNVQHFTIRNADAREFPPSEFHYLTPKLGIFDCEKLEAEFKPLGCVDT